MGTTKDAERKILVELTDLLLKNADKVLEGDTKVCLTTSSLEILVSNFRRYSMGEAEDEAAAEAGKSAGKRKHNKQQVDLKRWRESIKTLLDFVLRIKALKIINSAQTMKAPIQIARFSSLQVLEVKKVPIHMVEGLSKLRGQLKELVVSKSLQDVQGLLEICGGDRTSGLVWSCLTTAILSFNGLNKLDSSLRLVPFLEMLDLSRNNLKDTEDHLQTLTDVAKMNFGYNLLSKVPRLSMSNRAKLRTLVLRNNNLDNLDGIEELIMLEELDVSMNCFIDHKVLHVLPPLNRLTLLYLVGNPLCYKPDHRYLTMKKLSPQTAMTAFILDGERMSPYEISIVRTNHYHVRRSIVVTEDQTEVMETIVAKHKGKKVPGNTLDPNDYDKNKKRGHRRIHSKERTPRIGNIQDSMTEEYSQDASPATSIKDETDFTLELEKEKQRYEILREHYKEDWLKALSAEQGVYDDKPDVSSDKPGVSGDKPGVSGDKPGVSSAEKVDEAKNAAKTEQKGTEKAGEKAEAGEANNKQVPAERDTSKGEDKPDGTFTVVKPQTTTSNEPVHIVDSTDIYAMMASRRQQAAVMAPEPLLVEREVEKEASTESEDQYGDESEPLIVMLPDRDLKQIFVTVNNRYILEKDTNGRKLAALDLKCLQVVSKEEEAVRGKDIVGSQVFTVLTLDFDYVKKDMRQRKYAMEDDHDALMLESLIYPHLKMKQDQAMARDQLECLRCKHQFSRPTSTDLKLVSCPSCKSKLVIKVEEAASEVASTKPDEVVEQTSHGSESPKLDYDLLQRPNQSPRIIRKGSGRHRKKHTASNSDAETGLKLQKESFVGSLSDFVDKLIPDDEALDQADRRKVASTEEDVYQAAANPETLAGPSLKPNNSWSDVQRMTASQSTTRSSVSSVESDITVLATNSRGSVSVISESSHEVLEGGNGIEITDILETRISVTKTQEQRDVEQKVDTDDATSRSSLKSPQGLVTPVGSPLSNSVCSSMVSSVYENTLSGGGEGNAPGTEENVNNILDSSFTSSSSDSVSIRHSAGSSNARSRRSKHRHATLLLENEGQSSPKDSFRDLNKSEDVVGTETSSIYDTALSQQTYESSLNSTNTSADRTFSSIYDKSTADSDSEKTNNSDSFLAVTRRSHEPTSNQETSSSSPLRRRNGSQSRSRSANRSAIIYGDSVFDQSVEIQDTTGIPEFPSDLSPIKKIPGQKSADVSVDGPTNGNSQKAVNKVSGNDENGSVSVTSGNDSIASEKALPWELEDSREKSAKHESLIHDEFVNIDHRIQLFLELHVLRAEEQIQCAIQCPIIQYMMDKEVKSLLVISSNRILILRVEGQLDSNVSVDCLKCYEDQPITELQYIDIGLGYQSLRLEFGTECSSFTLLICDEARCKQFLTLLSDIVQTAAIHEHSKLEGISKSNPTTVANLEQIVLEGGDEGQEEDEEECQKFVRYLLVRYMNPDVEDDEGRVLGLIVTTTDLILVQESHQWPLPRLQAPLSDDLKGKQFAVLQREKINNVETFAFNEDNHSALRLTFFENSGGDNTDAAWYITMETTKGVKSLVDAIREPWEEEFGVSLDVTSTSFTEESSSNDKAL